MRAIMLALSAVLLCQSAAAVDTAQSIDHLATHHQTGVIQIADGGQSLNINAFCLDSHGQIVAACGEGPGEIRIVNDEGKILNSWKIDEKPEAINVADDGTILVGGAGKLFRFDSEGKRLQVAESPHALRLRNSDEQLRKAAIVLLERQRNPLQTRIASYQSILEQLEQRSAKGELNASEKQLLQTLPTMLERYQNQLATQQQAGGQTEGGGPTEEAIQHQIEMLTQSKLRISSITSSGNHVFIATRAIEGYGYDVWKLNPQFAAAEVIVTGLSGCCGQMDVQCSEKGLFVAENSRDRVVHYDLDGNEITHWGKSDRTGIDGFTSCCNPMNVCFDSDGHVYTAEATSGRIKRFSSDGNLVDFIGDVDLVPGCKNVSIAVSKVNDNIYMLDLTRNHIKRMQPKPAGAVTTTASAPVSTSKEPTRRPPPQRRSTSAAILSFFGLGGDSDE